ncbi:D-alanyl-D-alanine carboxypeptidase family protein [Marinagarivorans algicola]|uniref:D-alanyl-D-alanine carboxypeptidase family protein n=1 Tax=Marinagarivorans algicola TaxID=1513270 RepID=UPI000AE1882F|nr:D-alanyl-D-alanine carboxypeptidase family protein [Marinagarivorans algicola]
MILKNMILKSMIVNSARCKAILGAFVFCVGAVGSVQHAAARTIIIPKPPQVAAKAYVLMDANTGHILVAQNADEQLPPASLTKIMTSYIVSEEIVRGELGEQDKVYVTDDAWRRGGTSSGGSTMFLKPRSEVDVIDLLRGVIIQSGNDASIALAQHIAGSEGAFADVMNQTATLLGMQNTHFMNATGWPAEGHLTTANDLALLAQATINDHPEHYGIYAEKSFTYNGIKQDNRNSLLFRDASVDGLKTGHTEAAGYCLVATAKKEGMRLISVVLGTRSKEARAVESQKLLSYGFRYYTTHTVVKAGQSLIDSHIWQGLTDTLALGVQEDLTLTVPRGSEDKLELTTEVAKTIKAPIKEGEVMGKLSIAFNGDVLYRGELVALHDVEQAGFLARLWDSLILLIQGLLA